MADSVEVRMSVTAIKRVDPYVKDILAKSTHVALYKFNPTSSEWEKTNTEGALFLYSRNGEPFHSIMILNRLNTDNLIEPIVKEFEYQMQAPFLLYRNAKSKIFGIWFYNREECVNLTILLETVMDTVKDKSTDKVKKKEEVDIFRLLTRAQEDFNKTPNKTEKSPQQQYSSTPRAPPDVTSKSVMDFFAKATTQPIHPPPQFSLQRLMSNPAVTVEHIEKQQRSTTPLEQPVALIKKETNGVPPTSPLSTFLNLEPSAETPQKPALMPPIMFASSSSKEKKQETSLMDDTEIEPLTKNQMLQALTYLLRNDSDFVIKLHEAYVKSLSDMVHH